MKKLLAVLLAAASAALCVGLSACDNGEETVQGQEEVLLYDFEDYDRNFQLMRVMSYFGAVDKNEQAQYVKSGTASALLRPLGWHSTMINNTYTGIKAESCLYIPLSSVRYDFDYTDASKLEQISFSMYNAEEEDLSLYLGLIFEKNATEVSDLTEFVLKPGWNDVFYLLDHDVLPYLYKCARDNDFAIVTYENEYVLTEKPDDEYVLKEALLNVMKIKKVDNFLEAVKHPIAKCLIVGEPVGLARLEKEMYARLKDRMGVFRSEPYFLELVPKGIDKARSLAVLLEELGMTREELMAAGDGFNDLSMVKFAGMGVAMANAQEVVKENADFITLSNDEDGVAHAVEKFILS